MKAAACISKAAPSEVDRGWLIRYARHCGFIASDHKPIEQCLRAAFGAAAWRVLCKSPKSRFLPILRNRELKLRSLIEYCQLLAARSFIDAPDPALLAYFINQRRYFYNHSCRIPQGDDYDLIRVASRHSLAGHRLSLRDIADVTNWAQQSGTNIQTGHKWSHLVMRARKFFDSERIRVEAEKCEPWHFYCASTDWRGYQITPITEPYSLWLQGQAQGNCLYKLRFECTRKRASRFFAVGQQGRVIATLEITWYPPEKGFEGMDQLWGKWQLQDLRLSHNRTPGEQLLHAMTAFAWMYNEWSKRPARQSSAPAAEISKSASGLPHAHRPVLRRTEAARPC